MALKYLIDSMGNTIQQTDRLTTESTEYWPDSANVKCTTMRHNVPASRGALKP